MKIVHVNILSFYERWNQNGRSFEQMVALTIGILCTFFGGKVANGSLHHVSIELPPDSSEEQGHLDNIQGWGPTILNLERVSIDFDDLGILMGTLMGDVLQPSWQILHNDVRRYSSLLDANMSYCPAEVMHTSVIRHKAYEDRAESALSKRSKDFDLVGQAKEEDVRKQIKLAWFQEAHDYILMTPL